MTIRILFCSFLIEGCIYYQGETYKKGREGVWLLMIGAEAGEREMGKLLGRRIEQETLKNLTSSCTTNQKWDPEFVCVFGIK